MIDKVYRDVIKELGRRKKASRYVKPSSLICVRKATFEIMGAEPVNRNTSKDVMRMEMGKAVHEMVQGHFHKYLPKVYPGWVFQSEIRLDETNCERAAALCVHAYVDGLISKPEPQEGVVLEFKSTSSAVMNSLRQPKPDHREQLNLYMYLMDLQFGEVFYIDRDDADRFQSFPLSFNDALMDETRTKIHSAMDGAVTGRLAPTPVSDYICRTCSYSHLCDPKNKKEWVNAKASD
jgi:CRISPR/Cas system-associated exonuclease Cas4 (RecB family)